MTPPLICDKHLVPVKEYERTLFYPNVWECPKCHEIWEMKIFKAANQMAKIIAKQTVDFWSPKNGCSVKVYKAAKFSTKQMLGKALKFKPIPLKFEYIENRRKRSGFNLNERK